MKVYELIQRRSSGVLDLWRQTLKLVAVPHILTDREIDLLFKMALKRVGENKIQKLRKSERHSGMRKAK